MATATGAEESELNTYWCHECDMSVALSSSRSSPLMCPHCRTHFLELMDSPSQNDAVAPLSSLSLFDSPFFHRLIHHHLVSNSNTNTTDSPNDDVAFEDPLSLLSPSLISSKTASSKSSATAVPVILVTSALLSQLDPTGVVSCAVCKDDIEIDEEAKQLPCNHLYHSDCITPWLELHDSCPLCRFRLSAAEEEAEGEEEDGFDGALTSSEIRSQLRAAMVRLSELMEEEEDDFYGLRTTLNHIASRHGLIGSNGASVVSEEGEGGDSENFSRIGGGNGSE
ncbi:E3 ubiquitin-protein ligase RING1-like [Arachis duranensis]|uniref:RING-type E3 ubiquitin transferase n=1 Tax=Arachis duranensis TaxID=130453 RepID=A0A6P4B1R8_ARADU|nr:E3 ubiquitin-protein ligase RING1-like [Arachis duranensis]